MVVDIITIFPAMVEAALTDGVVARARDRGLVDLRVRDLREFTTDRHRSVDDVPYGGGPGMVMKPEPLFRAVEAITAERGQPAAVVLMSPQGRQFTHQAAERLSRVSPLVLICGRYEGIDERVTRTLVTEELSIGDYVLTGGELPALVVLDAVVRLVPGVVGDADSVAEDSFVRGLLDHPHYTRPAEFRGLRVPETLLSGHHAEIEKWRARERVLRTLERRPEMLDRATLTVDEQRAMDDLQPGAPHLTSDPSERAARTERGVGAPARERVGGTAGAKPPGSTMETDHEGD
jgi:tRNA (guanine37-N1)-methyltransferase